MVNQKAKASENSSITQVSGVLIQQTGLSFTECERLFNLLWQENFPKLEAKAIEIARNNVDILSRMVYEKIISSIDEINIEKLAQPDTQYAFNTAIQHVARKGNKIDIETLAELLKERIKKDNNDYLENCIESAIEMIPKLTHKMLNSIALIYFVNVVKVTNERLLEVFYRRISEVYLEQLSDITISELKQIGVIGAAIYGINYSTMDTFSLLQDNRYSFLNIDNVQSKYPYFYKVINFFDEKKFHLLNLTTSGELIGSIILEKITDSMR
ncbi:LPO_1073/Vpar_1526 family protein [Thorsellia anophelis]|uniref:Uncharacterized protein n=1 Tax=Thorsellia anophelis DSM 18579 TaxID=1123402 RepID=A0A1I0CBT1_9GAMM|nr:LPO_1073/Vpar_1526 family protein [Thorsellia anophelis]SET16997.1 hypothetical protein SAMN02583745_01568 [Thorsellia anophelis DSM 18579]